MGRGPETEREKSPASRHAATRRGCSSAPRQFTVQQDLQCSGLGTFACAVAHTCDGESTALQVSGYVPPPQPGAHVRRLTRHTNYCCFHLLDGEAASPNLCLEAKIVALPDCCTKGRLSAFHSQAIVHSSSKVTSA
eukprot:scaffold3281_cov286-Prasinococcus_capsulatus_cf.AAC.15